MENTRFTSGDFEITFYYYDYRDNPFPVGETALAQAATECVMYCFSEDWSVNDFSYCSVNDQYDVALGEEIALKRAMDKIADLTTQEIEDIWSKYYEWALG